MSCWTRQESEDQSELALLPPGPVNLRDLFESEMAQKITMSLCTTGSSSTYGVLMGRNFPDIASQMLDVTATTNVTASVSGWGAFDTVSPLVKALGILKKEKHQSETSEYQDQIDNAIREIQEIIQKTFRSMVWLQLLSTTITFSTLIIITPTLFQTTGHFSDRAALQKACLAAAINPSITALNSGVGLFLTKLGNSKLNTRITVSKALLNIATTLCIYFSDSPAWAFPAAKSTIDLGVFLTSLFIIHRKHPELDISNSGKIFDTLPGYHNLKMLWKIIKSILPQCSDSTVQLSTTFLLARFGGPNSLIAMHALFQSGRWFHSLCYAIGSAKKITNTSSHLATNKDHTIPRDTQEKLNRAFGIVLSLMTFLFFLSFSAAHEHIFSFILPGDKAKEGKKIALNLWLFPLIAIPFGALSAYATTELKILQRYKVSASINFLCRALAVIIGTVISKDFKNGSSILAAAFIGVMLSSLVQFAALRCNLRSESDHTKSRDELCDQIFDVTGMMPNVTASAFKLIKTEHPTTPERLREEVNRLNLAPGQIPPVTHLFRSVTPPSESEIRAKRNGLKPVNIQFHTDFAKPINSRSIRKEPQHIASILKVKAQRPSTFPFSTQENAGAGVPHAQGDIIDGTLLGSTPLSDEEFGAGIGSLFEPLLRQ